jgi:hypothetical protein
MKQWRECGHILLKYETQKGWEQFLGNKWLYINEEIAYRKTISCNKIIQSKNLGKFLYNLKLFCSPSLSYLLLYSRCRGFWFSFDHTQMHSRQDCSDRGIGPLQRPLPDNTNTVQEIKIHAPRGILTHDPRKCSAADLHLRMCSYWDRHKVKCKWKLKW